METKVVPIKNVKMDWFLPVDLKDASSVQIASHHCVMCIMEWSLHFQMVLRLLEVGLISPGNV